MTRDWIGAFHLIFKIKELYVVLSFGIGTKVRKIKELVFFFFNKNNLIVEEERFELCFSL